MHLARDHTPLGTADGKIDLPRCGGFAFHKGKIDLLKFSLPHSKGKLMCRMGVSCSEDNTARFTVKTGDGAENIGVISVAIGKCVGKGIIVVSVRGVGRHITAFVAKCDVLIFIEDRNGKVAGDKVLVAFRIGEGKGEHISLT